jgi:hypothetical protein
VTSVGETDHGGRVVISRDGQSIEYTPPDGFAGTDSFEYVADDTYTARVTVTVPRPVADDLFVLAAHAADAELPVLANDVSYFYPDSKDVIDRVTSVGESEHGGAVGVSDDGQSLRYTPPRGFVGTDSITYVADGGFEAHVTIFVQFPVSDDWFAVAQNSQSSSLDVLQNDFRGNGSTTDHAITAIGETENGGSVEISADGKSLLYTPPRGFVGSDSFTYQADGAFEGRATVSVFNPMRDDVFSVRPNSQGNVLHVLANDLPGLPAGDHVVTDAGPTEHGGSLNISADGRSILYSPPLKFFGTDSFRYIVDGNLAANVIVHVVNPVRDDAFDLLQNSADNVLDVLANDDFGDGYTGDRVITEIGPTEHGGSVRVGSDGRSIVYSPPSGFVGSDSFRYVADGAFAAHVSIRVIGPARDDDFIVPLNSDTNFLDLLANDLRDSEYSGDRLVTSVGATDAGGSIAITADRRGVAYTPPRGFLGTDRFTYTIDGRFTATVTIGIDPSPRAILSPDWFTACADQADTPLDVLQYDPRILREPGEPVITRVSQPGDGADVRIARDSRSLLFSNEGIKPRSYSFTYTVFGQFTTTVTVVVEHASFYPSWDNFVVDQNSGEQSFDVLINDWFGDHWRCGLYAGPREVTAVGESAHAGTVTISADRKHVLYTPTPDFFGRDTFNYQLDGGPWATVSVAVIRRVRDDRFHVEAGSGDNKLPVLVNDLFGANYAGAGELSGVTTTRAGGRVTITSDRRAINYTPPAGFDGLDSFTYTVDGRLKAEVTVQVGGGLAVSLPRFQSAEEFYDAIIGQRADQYYGSTFGYEWSYENWEYEWQDRPLADGDEQIVTVAYNAYATRSDSASNLAYDLGSSGADRIHSDTNTQIAGVDEADIIENDGTFLYVVSRGELLIAKAWPADELSLVSRLAVDGTPIGAYLNGDRLTVVSRTWSSAPTARQPATGQLYSRIDPCWFGGYDYSWGCRSGAAQTLVTILDVSDRTAPRVVRKTTIDGDYVESRRIGRFVYLVQQSSINVNLPYPRYACETDPVAETAAVPVSDSLFRRLTSIVHCRYESRDDYMTRVTADLAGTLAGYTTVGPDGELLSTGVAVPPDRISHPRDTNSSRLLYVASIDMNGDDPGLASSTGILASSASKIFGSLENLYVFDQAYSADDGTTTEILKFGWDASDGSVAPRAQGAVAGTMLNQFSADEHDGYLRIATTINNSWSGNWSGRSENTLFVLGEDGGVLEFVGGLQNLGVSETIKSVRFTGDRAFVTTFRDVDPLFALDLSDPSDPRAVGHVTLPGFSSYMQFIDDYHILAIGRNAARGTAGTTQIALFDVTDLTNPRLIDRDVLPRYTESIAEADHHAFGWFAHHQLLGLPTSRTVTRRVDRNGDGFRESWQSVREDELFLYRIDATVTAPSELGIQMVGDLQHDSAVLRAAFIDQVLYSVAERSITAVPVSNPSQRVAEIGLEPAGQPVDRPHVVFGTVRSDGSAPLPIPVPPDPEPAPVQTPSGPRVTDVSVTTRKRRIVAIEMHFDTDLDAAAAINLAHFEAHTARPARRAAASAHIILPVRSATYDASTHTVTLTLARPLKLDRQISVLVKDTLTGRDGTPLADNGDSLPHTTIVLDASRRR